MKAQHRLKTARPSGRDHPRTLTLLLSAILLLSLLLIAALPWVARAVTPTSFSAAATPTGLPAVAKSSLTRAELDQWLMLPQLDRSVTDPHAQQALAAYDQFDYDTALIEACKSVEFDPAEVPESTAPDAQSFAVFGVLASCDELNRAGFEEGLRKSITADNDRPTAGAQADASLHGVVYHNLDFKVDAIKHVTNLAVIYFQQGTATGQELDQNASLWLLRRVMEHAPAYTLATLNYVAIGSTAGLAPLELIQKVVQREPDNVTARYYDAALFSNYADAEAKFAALANAHPEWPLGAMGLADLYLTRGLETQSYKPFVARRYLQQALQYYESALACQPDLYELHVGKAVALSALDAADQALTEMQTALAGNPAFAGWQNREISLHEAKGEYTTAAALLRQQLAIARIPRPLPPSHWLEVAAQSDLSSTRFTYGLDRRRRVQWFPWTDIMGGAGGFFTDAPEIIPSHRTEAVGAGTLSHLVRDLFFAGDYVGVVSAYGAVNLEDYLLSIDEFQRYTERQAVQATVAAAHLMTGDLAQAETPAELGSLNGEAGWHSDWLALAAIDRPYYLAGDLLRQAGRFAEASRVYQAWCAKTTHVPTCQILLAEAEYLRADYLAARDMLAAAVRQLSNEMYPRLALGSIYVKLGQTDLAAAELAKGRAMALRWTKAYPTYEPQLDLEAVDRYIFANLGTLYFQGGDYTAAVLAYRQAIPGYIWDTDMRAWLAGSEHSLLVSNLGTAYLALGNYDLARSVYEKAIEMDAANPVFHMNLGWTQHLMGDTEAAARTYRQALALDSSLFPVHNDLGVILAQSGQVDAALSAFKQALAYRPDYDLATYNLGITLLKHRPWQILQSQVYLGRALAANPELRAVDFEYMTDSQIYLIQLKGGALPAGDWSFTKSYHRSAIGVTGVAILLLVLRLIWSVIWSQIQDTAVGRYVFQISSTRPVRWLAAHVQPWFTGTRLSAWASQTGQNTRRWLSTTIPGWLGFAITAAVIALVTLLPLVKGSPALWSFALITFGITAWLSLLAHQVGHRLIHLADSGQHVAWLWPLGSIASLLLVGLTGYVYIPTLAVRPSESLRHKAIYYAAGPLLNLGLSIFFYIGFVLTNYPVFRIASSVNIMLVASSLFSIYPMDGYVLDKSYKTPLLLGGLLLASLLAALQLGII